MLKEKEKKLEIRPFNEGVRIPLLTAA